MIDVARTMRGDGTWNRRDVEDSFPALLHKEFVQMIPELLGALRRWSKEGLVSFVGFVILLDKITNVDLFPPKTRVESMPGRNRFFSGGSRTHLSPPSCCR